MNGMLNQRSWRGLGAVLGGVVVAGICSLSGAERFVVEDGVDHVRLLSSLDEASFARGKRIYESLCVNCHGADGKSPSLPVARALGVGPFKFGGDPFSLYQTLAKGNGLMGAQSWMSPEERYDVIHYLREAFMKSLYADYQEIDQRYLERFPKFTPESTTDRPSSEFRRDFGGALASQLRVNRLDGTVSDHPSVLSLQLGDSVSIAYDLHRMQQAAFWREGFLDLSGTQHERPRGEFVPMVEGKLVPRLQSFGWLYHGSAGMAEKGLSPHALLAPRGPLPKHLMEYRGYFVNGNRILLSYTIHGRTVTEMPQAAPDINGVVHSFEIEPGSESLSLLVGQGGRGRFEVSGLMAFDGLRPIGRTGAVGGYLAVSASSTLDAAESESTEWLGAGVFGDTAGLKWEIDGLQRLVLHIPPSAKSRRFEVFRASGNRSASFYSFAGYLKIQALRGERGIDLKPLLQGGSVRWPEALPTQVKRGNEGGAYEKDEVLLPEPNPWNAWMRTAALDFFDDGRMAVSTHGGDVWLVSNLDSDRPQWKRYAAGLYEPFGLKVVEGKILLTCKDRLVRLHDLNGDDEADFYESFYADWDVSMFFHAFNFDLQTDGAGNLYYAKSGQYTDFRLPGAVIRVSPDGSESEVMATGFRTPNGLGMLPDGRVTIGDNQGNWIPASKVSVIRPGGFYGYVNNLERKGRWAPDGGRLALDRVPVPSTFESPLIWMPQEIDSSCGGQVWVDDERWGPLAGRLIHTSFGKARVFYMMIQEFDDVVQGALVKLPFQFQAGVQRARVNPADGQLYLVGLHGWNGGWPKELGTMQHGGVYRIRYTGQPLVMVSEVGVASWGLRVQLNAEVDRDRLTTEGSVEAEAWNYRWTQRYGSDQFSILDPERKGRTQLVVDDVSLGAQGRVLKIRMPELRPCHQLRLSLQVPLRSGGFFQEEVLFTINGIPETAE